jgi:hypothetical protein
MKQIRVASIDLWNLKTVPQQLLQLLNLEQKSKVDPVQTNSS